MLNNQSENNVDLKHLGIQKLKNQGVAHEMIADFVFRFTYYYC